MENPNPTSIQNKPDSNHKRRGFALLVLFLLILISCALGLFVTGQAQRLLSGLLKPARTLTLSTNLITQTTTPGSSPTLTIDISPTPIASQPTASPLPVSNVSTQAVIESSKLQSLSKGYLVLSYYEGLHAHLFVYLPDQTIFTRLTDGNWDDINPSVNPAGNQIAFASNRGGFWDIYILDLTTGQIHQLTNTTEYDGSPSWSPDGQWIVYESYISDPSGSANLELMIRELNPATPAQTPLQLTSRIAADFDPAWSPDGRKIAFVSIDSGKKSVWLANLDNMEDRLKMVSGRSAYPCSHPSWSPDGLTLLWSSSEDGIGSLYTWQPSKPELAPQYIGVGDWATWDDSGKIAFTLVETPNQSYLSGFYIRDGQLVIAPQKLQGNNMAGLSWSSKMLPNPMPSSINESARITPTPAWQVAIASQAGTPNPHIEAVPLSGVSAPFPYLNDLVDEAWQALRKAVMDQIAWDYLSTLENAYIPLTSPLSLGMLDDWLYTGRAFAASKAPSHAGWLLVVRQDFGSACYWRLFLRTRFQDGSQGMPLKELPWDFRMRLDGNPRYYEQGGGTPSLPSAGYWFDFTRLASSYGWERLPALSSWRQALPSARYNEFLYRDGLDWYAAMIEIYPEEAVITVTPPPPPTATPTRTPIPSPTATSNLTPTLGAETLNPTEVASTATPNPGENLVTPTP
jgi:TolB protein